MPEETIKKPVKMKQESHFIIHKNRQDREVCTAEACKQNKRTEAFTMVKGISANVVSDYGV